MSYCSYRFLVGPKKGQECGRFLRKKGEERCFQHKKKEIEHEIKKAIVEIPKEEALVIIEDDIITPIQIEEKETKKPDKEIKASGLMAKIQEVKDEMKKEHAPKTNACEMPKATPKVVNKKVTKPKEIKKRVDDSFAAEFISKVQEIKNEIKRDSEVTKQQKVPPKQEIKSSKFIQLKCDKSSSTSSFSDSSDFTCSD